MKRSLLGLALLAARSAQAQPMLVKDINPGTTGSFPVRLTAFGDKLVFGADDGTNGNELWMLDTSGANLAYNINPAALASMSFTNNRSMGIIGKFIYFPANGGTNGVELWKWDGMNPPTQLPDVAAGTASAAIDEVVALNGKVYFDANDGSFGEELWAYDTLSGISSRLTDINTLGTSNIANICIFNNKLYFSATNGTIGNELYSYDPATNGTTLVMDIETGANSSSPNNFYVYNNKLYFSANTTATGRELYSYNGVSVQRLTDLVSGATSGISTSLSGTSLMLGMGNAIYFSGNESAISTGHLYKYDIATGVASLVYKTNPTGSSSITNMAMYPNRMMFSATNGTLGSELWQYNGTGIPTMMADIRTGVNSSSPAEFCLVNKTMYFQATDSANGTELFKYYDTTFNNTGIKNVAFNADVKVYPNPASSNVVFDMSLENNTNLNISITDMTGRIVYNSGVKSYNKGANIVTVPVTELATGSYIYSLRNENGRLMMSGHLSKQ